MYDKFLLCYSGIIEVISQDQELGFVNTHENADYDEDSTDDNVY